MVDDENIAAAALKNKLALDLLKKGRLPEALDALNQAIRIAPSYPHTYANRSLVFEQMALPLQAEAELEHARELVARGGYSEEEVFGPPAASESEPQRVRRTPRPTPISRPRRNVSSGTLGLIFATIGVIVLMVVAVVVLPGLFSNSGDNHQVTTTGGSSSSPTVAVQSPSPAPPLPATEGSPFSSDSLAKAWRAKGFEVASGQPVGGIAGFQITSVDIVLRRSGGSARLAAFVYKNADAPQQDWDLPTGSRPSPKPGRSLPDVASIWWNANIVVVVISAPEDISADALDAFLNMPS